MAVTNFGRMREKTAESLVSELRAIGREAELNPEVVLSEKYRFGRIMRMIWDGKSDKEILKAYPYVDMTPDTIRVYRDVAAKLGKGRKAAE